MVTERSGPPNGWLPGFSTGMVETVRFGRLVLVGLALCLFLSACESLFGDSEATPERVATAQTGGQDPNLGDVPTEAPVTSSAASRSAAREGLLADRAQARYTDETLTGEGLVGTAPGLVEASPPAPAATPTPSAPPFSSLDSSGSLGAGAAAPSAAAAASQQPTQQAYQLGGSRAGATQSPAQQPAPAQAAATPQLSQQPAPTQQVAAPAARQALATPPALPPGPPVLLGVIYFNHGSTALSGRDLQVLRQVVALHRERGGVLRVVGHASQRTGQVDPRVHQQINQRLSQRRAESVARALRGFGLRPEQVVAEGRGDSELLFYEFMPTGEAGNRRVEIFLQS